MTILYRGDIQETGDIEPFVVSVKDGIAESAVNALDSKEFIELDDDPERAQAILIRSATKFKTAQALEEYPRLMHIARAGVGTDNINHGLAARNGISTVNTPGSSTKAVATRALTFMLSWAGRIPQANADIHNQEWTRGQENTKPVDLTEKQLGIIGYGRIGQMSAKMAEPHFGNVVFTDVRDMDGKVELDELLETSDVISIHMAGNSELLTEELLAKVKDGALIVNTARGGVVNNKAMRNALDRGVHYATDVFSSEGKDMFDDPELAALATHPNVIGTPHTGASDTVTQRKLGEEAAKRTIGFANSGEVNPDNIPGLTLGKFNPNGVSEAGVRFLLSHKGEKGALASITSAVDSAGHNISKTTNIDGPEIAGHKLAVTSLDVRDIDPDVALKVMKQIEQSREIYKKRLMQFS